MTPSTSTLEKYITFSTSILLRVIDCLCIVYSICASLWSVQLIDVVPLAPPRGSVSDTHWTFVILCSTDGWSMVQIRSGCFLKLCQCLQKILHEWFFLLWEGITAFCDCHARCRRKSATLWAAVAMLRPYSDLCCCKLHQLMTHVSG